ncbi:2-octaprenyl-6-methoxyphenyl hydroxylase [Frederiksenia canicola]|uniref:2-octaprenyl-6-methoxyphenol hydroxylase n=1 Tax=Frederiksenia canicola TaxID=123824 RepID=A0AAE7C2R2_9PAST|nr:2-octaprenyl-6-methoxyphenyl hydroxylase [Frederiksenia canicola]QIM64953.1 2-octaprenyl-6-methoxyphenyl hydroxylase [Frederiksenia canicola]RPE96641.1 2-octaprenyl-6-methoxyphenol hydroxylase [Frederiksenia canicola]
MHFDIAIIGGAITGSVLALALSSATQHKMRIAIVEKNEPNYAEQGGFDARSIALAYGSLQKMAKIRPLASGQLSEQICKIATPIEQIHVSDRHHFGKAILSAQELKLDKLGVVVELAKTGELLAKLLAEQPNIQLFCPDTVENIESSPAHCKLTLSSQQQLECALIVAADGMQSHIAKQCGVATEMVKDYQQSAIIANVELTEPHRNQAFERFTPQGPFALLPLTEKTMSLVWCLHDPSEAMSMTDSEFITALQHQFGWKLGKFVRVSKRFVYPLSSQKSESHIHHRLAIVGNAAQLLHPVAGQGFNLGMRDLFALATLVGEAFNQGKDIGEYYLLAEFDRQRHADQQRVMRATSGLILIFGCEFLPIQAVRNLGLFAISHSPFLRNQVAHQALGW